MLARYQRLVVHARLRQVMHDPTDFDKWVGVEAVLLPDGWIDFHRLDLLVLDLLRRKPHFARRVSSEAAGGSGGILDPDRREPQQALRDQSLQRRAARSRAVDDTQEASMPGPHIHTFDAGAAITNRAAGEIIGGRLVAVAGPRAVATATANDASVLGVAATDAAPGDNVLVLRGGVQELTAASTITASDRVTAAGGGAVATAAAGERSVGLALTTASAARLVQIALDR